MRTFKLHEIVKCTHLKFTVHVHVYGRKQTYTRIIAMQSCKCGAHSGLPQGKYAHNHETNIHCLEITSIAMTIIFIAKMIIFIVMKPILKTWRIYSTINRRKILVTLGRVGRTQQWRKPALFISRCLRRAA